MKSAYIYTLIGVLAVGCAAPRQTAKPALAVVTTEVPKCHSKRQCEAMWADAQETIGMVTGMRNRIITDSRIETYPANGYGRMTGIVTKTPIGEEAYEIRVRFECYQYTTCDDMRASGTNMFNTSVEGSGITFR